MRDDEKVGFDSSDRFIGVIFTNMKRDPPSWKRNSWSNWPRNPLHPKRAFFRSDLKEIWREITFGVGTWGHFAR